MTCPESFQLNGSSNPFPPIEFNKTSFVDCKLYYYVFDTERPYYPLPDKAEAICQFSPENQTVYWQVVKQCEPSCNLKRCQNDQPCNLVNDTILCDCDGYIGKYCENVDPLGYFFFLKFFVDFFFFLKIF